MFRRAERYGAPRLRPERFSSHACVRLQSRSPVARGASALRDTSDPCVLCRFSQVTLPEVLGDRPPRAFQGMSPAEREQLYWDLKAQTTAQRVQQHLAAQTPPVRFGPNRVQTPQPRPVRRARVLSSEGRRARLAQEGRPAAQPPPARTASPPPQQQSPSEQHGMPPMASQHAASQSSAPPPTQPATPPLQPPPSEPFFHPFHMEWSPAQTAVPPASQPAPPPPDSQPAQSHHMECSLAPPAAPSASQPAQSSLFPARPQVYCIPASPPPSIPSRPFFLSLHSRPPAFPERTSLYSLTCPSVIPPRPFIFSVGPLGIPPRPYFLSGQCIQICQPVIPERLFFMSGQCVSSTIL